DRVVTFSVDGTARLWDPPTGRPLAEPMRHADQVWSAQFSPDGQRVATITWGGAVRLWDAHTGLALTESLGGGERKRPFISQPDDARFTPDGQRILCWQADHSARLVDVYAMPKPAPVWLAGLADAVAGREFDRDGHPLVAPLEQILRLQQGSLDSLPA